MVNKHAAGSGPNSAEVDRIIEMAWEDRTPFEVIDKTFALNEAQVIALMRKHLKPGSFKRWRARVAGRKTKHQALRSVEVTRFRCATQNKVSQYRNR